MTNNINEEHIRVAAYYIWQNAGCPQGREKEFWQQACNQLFGMNNSCAKTSCKKATKSVASKKATKKVGAKASSLNIVSKPVIMNNLSKKAGSLNLSKPVMAKPFYGIKK